MKLVKINQTNSKNIPTHRFSKREKGLQNLVEAGMKELLDASFVGTEMMISYGGRIDSIGITAENQLVLVEYKERASKDIFAQGLFYVDCAVKNPNQFAEYVYHETGKTVNMQIPPKIILISKTFTTFQKYALSRVNNEQQIEMKEYEIFKQGNEKFLTLKNIATPKLFEEAEPQEDMRIIKATPEEIERLTEIPAKPEYVKKIIEKNLETVLNAKKIKQTITTEHKAIEAINTPATDLSTDRLLIIEYDTNPEFIQEAIIKKKWSEGKHEQIQTITSNIDINWGFEGRIILLANKFSPIQRLFLNSINEDILPLEYTLFEAEDKTRYLTIDTLALPKHLNTYPRLKIYGLDDSIKQIDSEGAKKAMAYLVGEINDLGKEIKTEYRKYGIGFKAKNTFCKIRPSTEHVNIKIKVEPTFKDEYGLTTNDMKQDDGYKRFNITKKSDVPAAMALIRQAYNMNKR